MFVRLAAPGATALRVEPSLRVSHPADPDEREADAVAARVVAGTHVGSIAGRSAAGSADLHRLSDEQDPGFPVQRALAAGLVGDPLEREADRAAEQAVMRAGSSPDGLGAAPAAALPGLPGGLMSAGRPLDLSAREYFEPRFGHDLSRVRIHTDEQAARSAQAVNALAFTAGQDLVFDTGRYGTSTQAQRMLLGHELAHVVQQSTGADPAAAGGVLRRQPGTGPSEALPPLSDTDPSDSPRYIDRLFEYVTPPSLMTGSTTFRWKEGAGDKRITIALNDLDQDDKQTFVALWKIHPTKAEALRTVELYRKATPGFAYYSFYLGPDNVILPTTFSAASAPLFHRLWPDLKRIRAESAKEIAEGYRQFGNAINPYPCTTLDGDGDLSPAINFTNCALPVLLHGYSIRSGMRANTPEETPGQRSRPGERPPRDPNEGKVPPPKEQAPPSKEQGQAPLAKEQTQTPPAKEQTQTAPAKEQGQTPPPASEPAKTATPAVRTPAQLRQHLADQGLSANEIQGLAGGGAGSRMSPARAALIERLLRHFGPEDLKALGKLLAEKKIPLTSDAVDALIDTVPRGEMADWIRSSQIAEVHAQATSLPERDGALEDSLSASQDPNARTQIKKKKPSPGPVPRQFLRGNFAHRFAEYLLDALRLPRPSQAEVRIELRDGTGDVIRTDRIILHPDRGVLLEIKPAGRSAEIGQAQLAGRLEALQREFPKPNGWTGRIVEYTPADVRAWLRAEARAARAAGLPVPDVEGIMTLLGF